jgi:hypothetical protein
MKRVTVLLAAIPLAVLLGCGPDTPSAPAADALAEASASLARSANAQGLVRTTWPSADDPGMPFYSRIDPMPPHVDTDGTWVAVAFYRDPACVPGDFNLLGFFDPPAAFACPQTVSGFSLWEGAAFQGAPRVVQIRGGGAVPVWIVPADAFFEAISDGVLTIGELAGLDGLLTGTATHFDELIHPHPNPPELGGGGGHPAPKLVQNARGTLEDGRSFSIHLRRIDGLDPLVLTRID